MPALRARDDMVEGEVLALAAILAGEAVAQEHVEPGEGGKAGRLDIALERHDRGQPHLEGRAAHQRVVFREDVDAVEEHRLDRVLPAPDRQRIVAQRPVSPRSARGPDNSPAKLSEHEPSNRRSVLRMVARGPSPNPAAFLLYSLRDALVKAPKSGSFRGFHALAASLASSESISAADRSIASMSASESPK